MLVEFRVKNYKSFRDEQVLSMVASSDKSLPDNTMAVESFGKQKLLRSAVVYGANASGKSNLIKAIRFADRFIRQSDTFKPETEIPIQLFQLDKNSQQTPAKFEFTFIHQEIRYQYGFTADRQRIYEEWLIAYPKGRGQTWFERTLKPNSNEYTWQYSNHLKGDKKQLEKLITKKPNALFLSVAATFEHEQLYSVYQWFANNLLIIDVNEMNEMLEIVTAEKAITNNNFHEIMKKRLQFADLGIADFLIEKKVSTFNLPDNLPNELRHIFEGEGEESMELDIQMNHQTQEGSLVSFPTRDESLGTRRYFALGAPWFDTFSNGATLFVDELDASLHPILVRALVAEFHNSALNSQNAQLIFNTHNVTLLDHALFRRDQIWFVEKDKGGASHLYPLLDFSPRKDESLAKGYLQGRYGAIPLIREDLWRGVIPDDKKS